MSVGVLLVTHGRLSQQIVNTLQDMLGELSLRTDTLEVRRVIDAEELIGRGQEIIDRLDHGNGVLVITDAFGSTPSNIANRMAAGRHCRVVAGLNLPMLIKIYNYPGLDLDNMAQAAVEGGQRGVLLCGDNP